MQQITITGYLSRDAETAQTQKGDDVTRWNVPVKQGFGDTEQTNWFRVSIWGKRAGYAGKARKGDFAAVTGELTIGEYQGKPQYEIRASDFQSVRTAPKGEEGGGGNNYASGNAQKQDAGFADDLDDDSVPFIHCNSIV